MRLLLGFMLLLLAAVAVPSEVSAQRSRDIARRVQASFGEGSSLAERMRPIDEIPLNIMSISGTSRVKLMSLMARVM